MLLLVRMAGHLSKRKITITDCLCQWGEMDTHWLPLSVSTFCQIWALRVLSQQTIWDSSLKEGHELELVRAHLESSTYSRLHGDATKMWDKSMTSARGLIAEGEERLPLLARRSLIFQEHTCHLNDSLMTKLFDTDFEQIFLSFVITLLFNTHFQ